MTENPKIIINRNAFEFLQKNGVSGLENVSLDIRGDVSTFPKEIKNHINGLLIEVELVPTGADLNKE